MSFRFEILKKGKGTQARLGRMMTPHGIIETPVFMPVGTVGTIKAMRTEEVRSMGADIILGNTYHLYLRPGHDVIRELGGLHRFMNWPHPILTDSGGFQVFSLGREPEDRQVPRDETGPVHRATKLALVTDEGVKFQSHVDGSSHFMTPELSIGIQEALGADIMMAFDECTAFPATREVARSSMERSLSWEDRSLKARTNPEQALFGIIQGGMYPDLRKECFEKLVNMTSSLGGFDGYAFGGFSVGEPMPLMYELLAQCAGIIPEKYPRYLMGVGMPEDLITCIDMGLDMFDCVIPTRNARNGMMFTKEGFIAVKQSKYARDSRPVEEGCECYTCKNYSRAYLRHMHLSKEILSSILSSIHNLHYYLDLLRRARLAIERDEFLAFKADFFSSRKPKESIKESNK